MKYSFNILLFNSSLLFPFMMSTLFQISLYRFCILVWPTAWTSSRKRAWLLTTLSSFIMTFASIPFVYQFLSEGKASLLSPLITSSWAARFTIYFMSYLCSDLFIGLIDYRESLTWVTGWYHHLSYLVLLNSVLLWNKQGIFLIACIEELPTLILSLGHLYPHWRSDITFGVLFFLTRIVFHGYLTLSAYMVFQSDPKVWYTLLFVFPLNLFWFIQWLKQQYFKFLGKKRN